MAGRSFRCAFVLAMLASTSTFFGCATGDAGEDVILPGGGGDADPDGSAGDTTAGDGTGGDDTGAADGANAETGGGDGSGDSSVGEGGFVSEGGPLVCDPAAGLTQSCGVGECAVIVNACTDAGTANTCTPKAPGVESCNGKDDDCDGLIDEDLGETPCGVGECEFVQKNCVDGAPKTCKPKTAALVETCDGKDNDCNGLIDDNLGTTTCGKGECLVTVNNCEAGNPKTCVEKTAGVETCNLKDDDCDGTVDNNIPDVTCGFGECANTATGCINGTPGTCIPKDLGQLNCGTGACVAIVNKCKDGVPQMCVPKAGSAETCNGQDDDCDGVPDNGNPAIMCPPGTNASTSACAQGGICKITSCQNGYVDVDGAIGNGCECTDQNTPTSCNNAADQGSLAFGSAKYFSSKNPILTRENWIKISFLQTRSNWGTHPKIELTVNPSDLFVIDVAPGNSTGGCIGTVPLCGLGGEGDASGKTVWETWWKTGLTGTYCAPKSSVPATFCDWEPIFPESYVGLGTTSIVYVKVRYKTGVTQATCLPYTLAFTNG